MGSKSLAKAKLWSMTFTSAPMSKCIPRGTLGDPTFLVITWPSYINVRTAMTPFFALAASESLTRISLFPNSTI